MGAIHIDLNCQREAGGFLYEKNRIKQKKHQGETFTKKTLQQLQEQFTDKPVSEQKYMIGKQEFIVVSHYSGDKDVDKVLNIIAERRAYSELLHGN